MQPQHKPLSQRRTPAWRASLCQAQHHTLARLLGAGDALILAGCASLPHDPPRAVTTALPASTQTALGRIAAASTKDPAMSGFWERLWLRLVGPLVPEALL